MDAWTGFGLLKLFLDVIDGGPAAAAKGVLMSGIPCSEILDAGEVVYGLFNLDGGYQGKKMLRDDQYVPFAAIKLVNMSRVENRVARIDFPELAARKFASMQGGRSGPNFENRKFPKF